MTISVGFSRVGSALGSGLSFSLMLNSTNKGVQVIHFFFSYVVCRHHCSSPSWILLCCLECPPTFSQCMKSQFDPGEGPAANLPADLVEAHPAAYDQLLDCILVLAHAGGELLQRGEARRAVGFLVFWAVFGAVRQTVGAVVELGARHLVMASRHVCSRLETRSSLKRQYGIRVFASSWFGHTVVLFTP